MKRKEATIFNYYSNVQNILQEPKSSTYYLFELTLRLPSGLKQDIKKKDVMLLFMMEVFPFVSVVLPTYNRSNCLTKCLDSLLSLSYPKEHLEIIVVDDASSDETPRILQEYQKKGIIVITHDRNTGPAGARNSGVEEAHGDIVAFIDDDCTVTENWLRELVKPYENPKVAGVGGNIVGLGVIDPSNTRSLFVRYRAARLWKQAAFLGNLLSKIFCWKPAESEGETAFYAYHTTVNMSYRKSILLEVGGFDETFVGGQDFDLEIRVARRGYKTVYAKNATVRHPPGRRSLKDFLIRECVRRGMGRAAFLNKYRWEIANWLFRERKIILFTLSVFALVAVFLSITSSLEPFKLLLFLLEGAILYELIEAARIARHAKNVLLTPPFFVFDCLRKIMLGVGFVKGIFFLLNRNLQIRKARALVKVKSRALTREQRVQIYVRDTLKNVFKEEKNHGIS